MRGSVREGEGPWVVSGKEGGVGRGLVVSRYDSRDLVCGPIWGRKKSALGCRFYERSFEFSVLSHSGGFRMTAKDTPVIQPE